MSDTGISDPATSDPATSGSSTSDAPASDSAATYGYIDDKEAYLKRLRRIEGQIRGLQRMVEEEQYCIDILTQVAATTKAVQSVALGLLEDHLSHCVANAVKTGGAEADHKVQEASDAIARLVRS